MTITVAIITYEREIMLKRCLLSLAGQERLPDTIVIIDSSAKANALDIDLAPSFRNRIHYIHVEGRRTIPEARNLAIAETWTDLITFIDDDAAAIPSYVNAIVKAFETYPNLGCVGGPAINATSEGVPLTSIIRDNKKRVRVLPWGEVRSDIRRWIPTKDIWVDGAQGNNMSYPLKLLLEIKGFDTAYKQPSFREESDVQMRLRRQGYTILYRPEAMVYHMPNESGGISDLENKQNEYFMRAGENARLYADKFSPIWLSRLSWILWSRNPPSLIAAAILTIARGKNYFAWHKGLWKKTD